MTKREHTKAFLEAVLEQLEDLEVAREVEAALQDSAVFGQGKVKITKDGGVEHVPQKDDEEL